MEGAPSTLLDNLNPNAGLANGTPVKLHSIIPYSENCDVTRDLVHNGLPGEIIDIPEPRAIVVEIPNLNTERWLQRHKSISTDKVLIPLVNKSHRKNVVKVDDYSFPFKSHLLELAFAITFHKVQGQTLPKVILDLNTTKSPRKCRLSCSLCRLNQN